MAKKQDVHKLRIPWSKTFRGYAVCWYKRVKYLTENPHHVRPVRRHIKLEMSMEEFLRFVLNNKSYKKIYSDWIRGGMKQMEAPSIDRIDNDGPYSLKNIQVISNYENLLKGTGEYFPNMIELKEKRKELMFALAAQDYTQTQIGQMFNLNRSTVHRILKKMPKNYKPKWVKNTV